MTDQLSDLMHLCEKISKIVAGMQQPAEPPALPPYDPLEPMAGDTVKVWDNYGDECLTNPRLMIYTGEKKPDGRYVCYLQYGSSDTAEWDNCVRYMGPRELPRYPGDREPGWTCRTAVQWRNGNITTYINPQAANHYVNWKHTGGVMDALYAAPIFPADHPRAGEVKWDEPGFLPEHRKEVVK